MAVNWDDFELADSEQGKPGAAGSGVNWDDFELADSKKQNKGTAADLATDLKRGVQQLPGMVTGLLDVPIGLVTGERYAGKAADALGKATGFQPSKWADEARSEYSEARRKADAEIDKAWEDDKTTGWDVAGAYLSNPGKVAGMVVESLPSMVAGGLAGRGALAAARGIGAVARPSAGAAGAAQATRQGILAGAGGEGAVMAGQAMDQIDEDVDARRAGVAALASGAAGAAFGVAGGRMAQRLGVVDPETLIAGGATAQRHPQGLARRVFGGAIAEGVFEELPQSVQEQMLQNWAEKKDLFEGVPRSAVEGLLAGGVMGGAFNALPGERGGATSQPGAEPEQDAPKALPAPILTGTPGHQTTAAEVERANAVAEAEARNAALWAARDEYEAALQEGRNPVPVLITDPEPLRQRIDEMFGIDQSGMSAKERKSYAKQLQDALDEQVAITNDENGLEVPLTMADYLDSQVRDADAARWIPFREAATRSAEARTQQLADEELTVQPEIPLHARMGIDPSAGPLSASAAIAVDSGLSGQMQQAAQSAQLAQADISRTTSTEAIYGTQTHQAVQAGPQQPQAGAAQAATERLTGQAVTPEAQQFLASADGVPAQTSAPPRPSTWRKNRLAAGKVARDLGIDPAQHESLASLLGAIDAADAAVASGQMVQPAGQPGGGQAAAQVQGGGMAEPLRQRLSEVASQIIQKAAADYGADGTIETAMKSRKVPLPLKAEYKRLKDQLAGVEQSIRPAQSQPAAPIMRRDDLVGAIMRITGGRGIDPDMALTLTGDTANRQPRLRGLFKKGGTSDMSDLAELLRVEQGYDVRDGTHLEELIREQAAGNPVYSMERYERDAAENAEKEYRDRVNQRAVELGLKQARGKRTLAIVEADIARVEAEQARLEAEAAEFEAREERAAIQAEAVGNEIIEHDMTEADFMRWLSQDVMSTYTQEDIDRAEQIRADRENARAEAAAIAAAEEQAQSRIGERNQEGETESGTRGTAEGTRRAAEGAGRDFQLDTYTESDLAAREAEERGQAEAESAAASKAEKDEQDRQFAQEVKRRSEAAASTFALGQDAMDNITGQGNVFDAAGSKAENQEKPSGLERLEAMARRLASKGRVTEESFTADDGTQYRKITQVFDGKLFPSDYNLWRDVMGTGDYRAFQISDKEHLVIRKMGKTIHDGRKFLVSHVQYTPVADSMGQSQAETAKAAEPEEAKESNPQQPAHIEDFGQKLEGARKDMPPSLKEELGDDEIASQPLSKIWPADAHEGIESDYLAALTFAARAEIPAKPRTPYKVRAWVGKVQTFREILQNFDKPLWREKLEEAASGRGVLSDFVAKVKLLEQLPRDTWKRVEKVGVYPDARRSATAEELKAAGLETRPYDPDKLWLGSGLYRIGSNDELRGDARDAAMWRANPFSRVTIDGKTHTIDGAGKIGPDEVQKVKELLGEAAPTKGGLTAKDFEIRAPRAGGSAFINRKGDSEYRKLKTFTGEDAVKQARDYLKGNTDALAAEWEKVKARDNVGKGDVRRDENRERTGRDWRNGKDVTPEMFQDALGFRGVQFGNWVAQGKSAKDRQGMLNEAYDALHDLADLLGIPPKAISLNGTMGLAFGARGSGKAAAHFEPSNLVINLTKTRGAGSLAHEWFHALDNYFARLRGGEVPMTTAGGQEGYRKNNYITYKPEPVWELWRNGARGPMLMQRITSAQLREELKKHPDYDASKTLEENAKAAAARGGEQWTRSKDHKEGVRPEVERAFAELVEALNASPMAKRANALDKAKDGYWGRIIERGARSFENYVISKMAARGWSNDYLANIRDWEQWQALGKNADRYPYLTPEEEAPVAEAFDALFDTVEAKETEQGVALYNRTQVNDKLSSADKSVYGMAAEGKSASEVLNFIHAASRSPFNRQLARLLLKTGIDPKISVGDAKTWKFDAGPGLKYAAAYNPDSNTVALFRPASAERHMLHELVHAATIQALGRKGLPSIQMRALFNHVKKSGKLKGMYGMTNVDEFVAEAFTNPDFQRLLKTVSAPQGSQLKTAWDWLVRIIKDILGLPASQQNALSQALDVGVALMSQDKAIRNAGAGNASGVRHSRDAVDDAEVQRQFKETERAYGGREAYDRAKAAGKTKLNYRQWVQVRTPAFKEWFGDHEIAAATPKRQASTFAEARDHAKEFQGQPLTNSATGIVATVSRNNLDKMLNGKAVGKSENPATHSLAVANLDALFERALLGWSKPDSEGDPNIKAVHRFFSPVMVDGRAMLAKMTVKETAQESRPNSLYTVEAISFEKMESPAAQWVGEIAGADGIDPRTIRSAGLVESLAQRVQDFNPDSVSKVVDPATGEPMVVYHSTNGGFTAFDETKRSDGFGYYFATSPALAKKAAAGKSRVIEAFISAKSVAGSQKIPAANWLEMRYDGKGRELAKEFDAAWVRDEGKASIVVRNPNQIKSATDNTGTFDPTNPDIRYSFAGQNADPVPALSRTDVAQAVAERFPSLERAVNAALRRGDEGKNGGLVVVEHADDLAGTFASKTGRSMDDAVQLLGSDENGQPQGLFDPQSGLTFLVGSALTTESAPAVLLHEAMHGKQREEIDARAMALIEGRARTVVRPTREFLNRVSQRMESAGEAGNQKEAAAYIVEEAVLAGRQAGFSAADGRFLSWVDRSFGKRVGNIVRDMVAMVRAWVLRTGVGIQPSIDDLVALAKLNLNDMVRGDVAGQAGFSTGGIRFSRSAAQKILDAGDAAIAKADGWLDRGTRIPEGWSAEQQAAAGKFATFSPKQPIKSMLRGINNRLKDRATQLIFDQFRPLMKVSKEAFMTAHLSKATDGALEAMANLGIPKLRDGALAVDKQDGGGFLNDLARLLGSAQEANQFLMWVAGNRAEKLNAEGRENLFTPADIDAMKAFSKGKLPDGRLRPVAYADAHARLNAYNKAVLDIAEQAGLIDGEARKNWESDFYIPFYRVSEESGEMDFSKGGTGLARQKVIQQLKGGTENLGDPLANIMSNWHMMLTASMRNMAANKALTQGETLGIADKVTNAHAVNMAKGGTWTMVNGHKQLWQVHDPMVAEALEALNFTGYNNPAMRAASRFKHMLTMGVTISPTFRIRNLMRDALQAVATADVGYNPLKNAVEGWKLTGKDSDTMAQLMAGGGAVRFGSFNDGQQAESAKRLIAMGVKDNQILNTPDKLKNFFRRFYDSYQETGDRAETINRAVIYQRAIAAGKTHLEASFEARDLMNFTSLGSSAAIRALAQVLPFFNARLQGMDRLVRGAAADPRRFWSVAGVIGMASALLFMLQGDDDEYKALPDYVRDAYWPVKLGGMWAYIPKPFEVGALGTVVERFTELMMAGDDYQARDFRDTMVGVLANTLAMNPVPQIVKPIGEAWFNYDMFRGQAIDSMAMERLLPQERFNANTSAAAVAAGRALEVSPQKVEHLVRGYFGWLGTQALNVGDLMARPFMDMPASPKSDLSQVNNWLVAGDMFKEVGTTPSKYSERFYNVQREINAIYATASQARNLGNMEQYRELMSRPEMAARPLIANANRQMTQINQQMRAVMADRSMSVVDKNRRLQELRTRRDDIARRVDERAREMG